MSTLQNQQSPICSHVVDILGSTKGRDQPILKMDRALEFASLLGEKTFEDENVVFFDPFCKAGEILLACALHSCRAKSKAKLINIDQIFNEIYLSHRYFALAPDGRHHGLSLRTFLGNINSHDKNFNHIIRDGHYLSEIDGTLKNAKFVEEFNFVIDYIKATTKNKRIIAIGNPPYQESDGGYGKSAKPIYHLFAETLMDCPDISEFVLVIPSRWFGGGKGLDKFRNRTINSKNIKYLRYFKNSSEVFPTVDINGGVCFMHWDRYYSGKTTFSDGINQNQIDISQHDIIPDDPLSYSIIDKVKTKWSGKWVSDVAWYSKPFGLRTFYFKKNKEANPNNTQSIPCLSIGRIVKYVPQSDISKNIDKIDLWKVAVPKAAGGSKGNRRSTIPLNLILLVPKGTITTETYNIVHAFKSKTEAERMVGFLKTNFSRYLIGLRKITQDIPRDRWNWVPMMDMSREWTDADLFDYFSFTKSERTHIKNKVQEWS